MLVLIVEPLCSYVIVGPFVTFYCHRICPCALYFVPFSGVPLFGAQRVGATERHHWGHHSLGGTSGKVRVRCRLRCSAGAVCSVPHEKLGSAGLDPEFATTKAKGKRLSQFSTNQDRSSI